MSRILMCSFMIAVLVAPGYLFSDVIEIASQLKTFITEDFLKVVNDNTAALFSENTNDSVAQRAEDIIKNMTPEQKAGQLMMVGFSGTVPDYYINRMLDLRHVGGVILFSRNIKSPVQVADLINRLQGKVIKNGDLPLFVAVDQEWGEITRFKEGITVFPGPAQLGKSGSDDLVKTSAIATGKELKAMGFNVNLAPVLDVADSNSIMANRAFGNDPERVADLGLNAIRGLREGGVIPAAKHFPGLGSAHLDPHKGTVEIQSDLNELKERDLVPFERAISEQVEMILVANAMYPQIDSQKPAGFSSLIQTGLLREEMGYQGVVLSDDLEMGAALSYSTIGMLAVQAIQSGADIVLVCHTPEKQKEAYEALLAAVKNNTIPEEQLNQSLLRIVSLKLQWKLDHDIKVDLSKVKYNVNSPEHQEDAKRIFQQLKNYSIP